MLQPPSQPKRNGNGNGKPNGDLRRRLPSRRWSLADSGWRPDEDRGDEVTAGIVGLGYWGPNILRVLAEQANVNVRWICDRDPDRLERMSRRYPSVIPTQRYEDLLEDPELDAILIVTPVGTHAGLAEASLEAGKHTFVEKPLAASAVEAERLAGIARESGLVLMCGHTFTYSPPVRAVKRMLESGELGDIYFISSSRVNLGLHQRDVSVLWDLGPHDFSILRYWLDEGPTSIAASGRDAVVQGIADVAFLTLEYGSGTLANLEMSWLAPSKLRRTVIVGSEKMVVYEDGAPEPVRVFDRGVVYRDPETFGEYHLSYRTGDIVSPHLDGSEPLAVELQDFVASIRGGVAGHEKLDLALDVVRMIEAAETSLLDSGAPVRVETPALPQLLS
jgi:predicted dehydrogenase